MAPDPDRARPTLTDALREAFAKADAEGRPDLVDRAILQLLDICRHPDGKPEQDETSEA